MMNYNHNGCKRERGGTRT